MAARSIIRWDVRSAENLLDVLEQADVHLAGQGLRICSWSEYAGELVLVVEPLSGSPASGRQTRVTKPETHR